jgi:hypothetical protein
MPFKPLDFLIVILALCAVVLSFFLVYTDADGGSIIALKAQDGEWVFPIDANETLLVAGPLGDTIIEIRESGARITASPCMNQTCVAAGIVHSPGQWAACLPNRVMLYISEGSPSKEGVGGNDVDATAW